MDRADFNKFYSKNVGLIHHVARKGYGRMLSVGASSCYDDLAQEMTVVFIKAFDGFSEEHGCKFSSYFTRAAHHRINRLIESIVEERITNKVRSVEEMNDRINANGDSAIDVSELIACERRTPEEDAVLQDMFGRIVSELSPIAAKIAEWLVYPPESIERESVAHSKFAAIARDAGEARRSSEDINLTLVCDLLHMAGVSRSALRVACRELKTTVGKGIR